MAFIESALKKITLHYINLSKKKIENFFMFGANLILRSSLIFYLNALIISELIYNFAVLPVFQQNRKKKKEKSRRIRPSGKRKVEGSNRKTHTRAHYFQ